MTNSKLIHNEGSSKVILNHRETIESNENGLIITKYPIVEPYFVYKKSTGEKITGIYCTYKTIYTDYPYEDFLVDYFYEYNNGYDVLTVGNPLTNGYLSLEGRTRVKDDATGQVRTGIIKIPKLKLLSNLSMRLGNDAIPQVGHLDAIAVPTGPKG
jgi:hypothetical protein